MAKNKQQKLALDILRTRPVMYNPDLAKVLGSVTAGVFLNQLLFWYGKGIDPEWTYKTVREFQEETALTKNQQLTAQKICVGKGVLEVKYKKVPRTRHFRVNFDKVLELLERLRREREKNISSSRMENGRSVVNVPHHQSDDMWLTISEMTKQR